MTNFEKNFMRYMDAGIPILYIDTLEDDKACEIIHEMCKENLQRGIIEWTISGGRDYSTNEALLQMDLADTLLNIFLQDKNLITGKIIILRDVQFYFDPHGTNSKTAETISAIKLFAQKINSGELDCNLCIVAPLVSLPKEIENYVTVLEMDFLDENLIRQMVVDFSKEQEIKTPDKDLLDKLAMRLKGLSRTEISNVLSLIISEDGTIDHSDLAEILKQKQQMIKKSGILEMINVKESMEDIGGLENLKSWLIRKAEIFKQIKKAQNFGVDMPKGVLIAGMPGCGKSLTAKAAAKAFDVPLLRLDMGRLMGKYVGESESNMRRAIKLTEASSPCVLWIDELEKAFAGIGGNGSEVTTRLFGNFLTWMQEKDSLAFVLATANNISKLPPELLRKGRFDEIFYVGLPNEKERSKIFEIHIAKRRKQDLKNIQIDKLVKNTSGYCGADLEGVVKEAVETAFVRKKQSLSTEDILEAVNGTHSISEVMKDSIEEMGKVYKNLQLKSASN